MTTALETARARVARLEAEERAEAGRRAAAERAEGLSRLEGRVAELREHWSRPDRYPLYEDYAARSRELRGLVAAELADLGGVADLADGTRLVLSEGGRAPEVWAGQWRRDSQAALARAEARARELAGRRAGAG